MDSDIPKEISHNQKVCHLARGSLDDLTLINFSVYK